jgi:GTPase SAR1 family protein
MNKSASTLTGKTKIKIVFLGDQSVGKTSIIERYIKNTFEDTANVKNDTKFSQQLESTFL